MSCWTYLPKTMCLWQKLWHLALEALFALYKRAPKLTKNGLFQKIHFYLFFLFVTLYLFVKKICFYDQICDIWPLRPFLPFLQAKLDIFKNHIHFLFPIVVSSIHTKNYFAMPKIVIFGLRTPFLKWAPKRGSNGKFQKSLKSHRTADIETLCAIN